MSTKKVLLSANEAVARGAAQAGCIVASAYPGTPSTEILENIAKFKDTVKCEWAVNEKVAMETAIGASMAGARALTAMKHVGLNVAMDPLMTFTYVGATGGMVVVTADDPGMHSSQNEQDNRNIAKFARAPMFEPSDSQEAYDMVQAAFETSEKYRVPCFLRLLAQDREAVLDGEAHAARVGRDGDVLLRVLDVGLRLDRAAGAVADVDERRGVRRARRHAEEDDRAGALGEVPRGAGHVEGLLRVGGLERDRAGELLQHAVVLLVLRGVHAGVVRRDDDEAAVRPLERVGHQRVHRDVEADVLHAHEGAAAGDRGADADLHRDLLVDGPLAVYFALEPGDVLENLGGGGAGVGGGDVAAGRVGGPGDGLVAGEEELIHAGCEVRGFTGPRTRKARDRTP